MAGFEVTRKIALILICLRHELRGTRAKLSDPGMATLLNNAQSNQPRPFILDGNLINKMRHMKYSFHGMEEVQLLAALQSVCTANGLDVDLSQPAPQWIEENYSRELPDTFARPEWLPLQGQPLGPTAVSLPGLWHFMYFSPVNRTGAIKPEIRGTAAIFSNSKPTATTVPCLLISKHTRWKGHAFVNETQMYLVLTDVTKVETAFFVTNKPSRNETLIAGVGVAQERDPTRRDRARRPPVAGFVCFGEKLSSIDGYEWKAGVQRVMLGEELSDSHEEAIRATFCETLTQQLLKTRHKRLFAHLNSIEINDAAGLSSSPSIYVAYDSPRSR